MSHLLSNNLLNFNFYSVKGSPLLNYFVLA